MTEIKQATPMGPDEVLLVLADTNVSEENGWMVYDHNGNLVSFSSEYYDDYLNVCITNKNNPDIISFFESGVEIFYKSRECTEECLIPFSSLEENEYDASSDTDSDSELEDETEATNVLQPGQPPVYNPSAQPLVNLTIPRKTKLTKDEKYDRVYKLWQKETADDPNYPFDEWIRNRYDIYYFVGIRIPADTSMFVCNYNPDNKFKPPFKYGQATPNWRIRKYILNHVFTNIVCFRSLSQLRNYFSPDNQHVIEAVMRIESPYQNTVFESDNKIVKQSNIIFRRINNNILNEYKDEKFGKAIPFEMPRLNPF